MANPASANPAPAKVRDLVCSPAKMSSSSPVRTVARDGAQTHLCGAMRSAGATA
jgi:hypothetical protein